jgi:HSP20 family protein
MLGNITRFDPISEVQKMNDVFDRLFGTPVFASQRFVSGPRDLTVPLDVVEKEDKLVIRAAVPGVSPDDLNVSIENGVLTISGETKHEEENEQDKVYFRECSYGTFTRSIRLPQNLQVDEVDAEFDNGFVSISLPKVPEEKPKALKVPVRNKK